MSKETLIEDYIQTRLDYDRIHAESTKAWADHLRAKGKLRDWLLDSPEKAIPLKNGLSFHLRNQFTISCNQENEGQIKEWLHDHYGDLALFTEEKVNKYTVQDRLKADIEGEQLDEFEVPDFMNLKTRPDVSCTGWSEFKKARSE
jgi:hypothetical protein